MTPTPQPQGIMPLCVRIRGITASCSTSPTKAGLGGQAAKVLGSTGRPR